MPEDVGSFKVRIQAEIDDQSSRKVASNIEKRVTDAMEKSTSGLGKKISEKKGGGMESQIGDMLSKNIKKIAAAAIGIHTLLSSGPIMAILKAVNAALQLTLYPIATFFLNFMKPILVFLLRYLIIPFYQHGVPFFRTIGEKLGSLFSGSGAFRLFTDPIGLFGDILKTIADEVWIPLWNRLKNISITDSLTIGDVAEKSWRTIKNVVSHITSAIRRVIEWEWNLIKTIITIVLNGLSSWIRSYWQTMGTILIYPLQKFKDFLSSAWVYIIDVLKDPFIKFIDWMRSQIWPWSSGKKHKMGPAENPLAPYTAPTIPPASIFDPFNTFDPFGLKRNTGTAAKISSIGGTVVNNTNYISKEVDADRFLANMENMLYRKSKRTIG